MTAPYLISRHQSAIGNPASTSFKKPMICDSVNLHFFISPPLKVGFISFDTALRDISELVELDLLMKAGES